MGLLQLPPEPLAMIARSIMPYDFENLSLTCKRAYEWARPLLPRHNEYRRAYRNFSFKYSGLATISDLLALIADDPIIASYMVHVELDSRTYCEDDDMDDDDYIDRMTEKLAPLVLGSPHLSMLCDDFDEPAELWLQEIVRDLKYYKREVPFSEFGVPFLATLLINVETLTLPEEWCDHCIITNRDSGHIVTDLLRLLVTRANDRSLQDQPLQKLRAIFPARDVLLQHGTVMEQLFPFLSLNSLKELHHTSGICAFARERTAFATLGRNLEVMKLKDYDIWGNCASLLFKDMHNLRVLEIEYSTRDDRGEGFQADLFMRSVITGTSRSLERLVFTGRELWPDTDVLDCSLRECTRLRHLELSTVFLVNGVGSISPEDAECIFGREDEGDSEDDEDGEDEEETSDEEDEECMSAHTVKGAIPEWKVRTTHGLRRVKPLLGDQFHPDDKRKMYKSGKGVWRLVSVLPESLESLVIHTPAAPRNSACVERMFWRFEELRAQRLPNLKQIEVYVHTRYPSDARINGYLRQTQQLKNFFADKTILTNFEICV